MPETGKITKFAVCDKCGCSYSDQPSIKMVEDWNRQDGYSPCPNLSCRGTMKIKYLNEKNEEVKGPNESKTG